ncbi:hypothetical protein PSCICO_47310 [Pseudomonas cichorii]|uniref:hypothetical protein n=1 Tax=Pseudomonas cichorii TaxID=36746 RepID=UPI0019107023|nr:hypothetical protein [Pseudomonas cichorii]GFM89332.1 hypothetical protein PSCICO_47310 [Pseudomonas cichorii]
MGTIGVVETVSETLLDTVKESYQFNYNGSEYKEDDPLGFRYILFRVGSSNRVLAKINKITIDLDHPGKAVFCFSELLKASYIDTVNNDITRLNEHNAQALKELFEKDGAIINRPPEKIPHKLSLSSALDLLSETYGISRESIKITISG